MTRIREQEVRQNTAQKREKLQNETRNDSKVKKTRLETETDIETLQNRVLLCLLGCREKLIHI